LYTLNWVSTIRGEVHIASRIPEEGYRIVLADGPEGEVWADLDPVGLVTVERTVLTG
jgi:hypothetical protein